MKRLRRLINIIIETIKDLPYNLKYGIKNLIVWFPIVWKNRNWDQYYIYKTLRHKLDLTEKHIRIHNNHVGAYKDARKIRICVLLLDRLINNDYDIMALKNHYKKWGDPVLKTSPCDKPGYSKVDIIHKNVLTKEDEKQERKEFKRAYEHSIYLRKQDIDYLFNMMKKYIEGWWD